MNPLLPLYIQRSALLHQIALADTQCAYVRALYEDRADDTKRPYEKREKDLEREEYLANVCDKEIAGMCGALGDCNIFIHKHEEGSTLVDHIYTREAKRILETHPHLRRYSRDFLYGTENKE